LDAPVGGSPAHPAVRTLPTSLLIVVAAACARNPTPNAVASPLRSYDIVIPGRDSLSRALSRSFSRAGFTVRDDVRGGGRAAAALVFWRFVDSDGRGGLQAELADTRRGTVLATASIPADTLRADFAARADLLVQGLLHPSP
jgi:hypothetical protein